MSANASGYLFRSVKESAIIFSLLFSLLSFFFNLLTWFTISGTFLSLTLSHSIPLSRHLERDAKHRNYCRQLSHPFVDSFSLFFIDALGPHAVMAKHLPLSLSRVDTRSPCEGINLRAPWIRVWVRRRRRPWRHIHKKRLSFFTLRVVWKSVSFTCVPCFTRRLFFSSLSPTVSSPSLTLNVQWCVPVSVIDCLPPCSLRRLYETLVVHSFTMQNEATHVRRVTEWIVKATWKSLCTINYWKEVLFVRTKKKETSMRTSREREDSVHM